MARTRSLSMLLATVCAGGFPESWLFEVIDGRTLRAAHGTADMLVWGWQFRLVEESGAHADARIGALVGYLKQMQTSP